MNSLKPLSDDAHVPVWITQSARHKAEDFAHQQPNSQKAAQVYQNTLAVYVVNNYLALLDIQTDLAASDSWNAAVRLADDVADLVIVGHGSMDCRPVQPGDEVCTIPLESQRDRIGYVMVRLDSDQMATLLGFVDYVNSEQVSLQQLRPMAELPRYLAHREPVVDLRQWLEGAYQLDWQPPEKLLRPKQLALSHPQTKFQRAKQLGLNLDSDYRDVILLVSIMPQQDRVDLRVQLHPAVLAESHPNGTRLVYSLIDCLIPNIRLSLKTEENFLSKEVVSRTFPRDNCIQLPLFQGYFGERFTIQISTENGAISQHFQL
ncbi:DUF1822 family protein [Oscillatoria sp. CS-180]|uniref:DUF1822 family protein n=1 Tax=Oscillatoria sp. CS-180 TaxID=3021720 RepID=UPI00232DEF57|nr:DUF1822 family protein [Oscillatoria sp. CS-180]MDB9526512.1 DUF1822 family protein [Oscillatoria sp. CS-180]